MLFDLIRPSKPLSKARPATPQPSAAKSEAIPAASPEATLREMTPKNMNEMSPGATPSVTKSPARSPRQRRRLSSPRKQSTPPAPLTPLDALKAQIKAIPPKTFHTSLISRLSNASEDQVNAITTLLEGLEPPPTLHCARCHANYFEEDNMDRSCVMDHDDNSTSLEHGQTLWGCCGEAVEGDGSGGPPPGWCYEGKHTTDRVKARYRDDYDTDASEDGLQSCKERRCKRKAEDPKSKEPASVHVIVTRSRGERGPPAKRKRLSY